MAISFFAAVPSFALDEFSSPGLMVIPVADQTHGQLIFGPEFTFAIGPTAEFADANDVDRLVERMRQHLVERQIGAAKFIQDGPRFTSPNGWSFDVKLDRGVVEVTMQPMTVSDFTRYQSDIQDAIFASASNENLYPALFLGGGHISVSVQTFKDKPVLLRNFLVDLLNHNELGLGIMNYDTNNALSPSLMNLSSIEKIRDGIAEFDFDLDNKAQRFGGELASNLLMGVLDTALQNDNSQYRQGFKKGVCNFKYTAFTLIHRSESLGRGRIEIRSIRPQASFDVFVRQIRLFEKRIQYLATKSEFITLKPMVAIKSVKDPWDKPQLIPPVIPQQALRAFYLYVTESGEKWSEHRDYLWPAWVSDGEVTKFENSVWFKERQNNCKQLLRK